MKADIREIKESWSKRTSTWNIIMHRGGGKIVQGKLTKKKKKKKDKGSTKLWILTMC